MPTATQSSEPTAIIMKSTSPAVSASPASVTDAEPQFTPMFHAMETPSDVPAWTVVILLAVLTLTWATVTIGIDAHTPRVPAADIAADKAVVMF